MFGDITITHNETVINDDNTVVGHWVPTKYGTQRLPERIENDIRIETLVEMYHSSPTAYDNRYACQVTDAAGRWATVKDRATLLDAERDALELLANGE